MTNYWQGGLISRQVVHHLDKRNTMYLEGAVHYRDKAVFSKRRPGSHWCSRTLYPGALQVPAGRSLVHLCRRQGWRHPTGHPQLRSSRRLKCLYPTGPSIKCQDGGVIARECELPISAVGAQCQTTVFLDGVPHPFIGVPQPFQYDVSFVTLAFIPVARLYDPTTEGFWTLAFKSSIQITSQRRVTTVGSHLAPQLGNLNDSNVRKQALITGLIKNCVDSAGVRSTLQGRGAF